MTCATRRFCLFMFCRPQRGTQQWREWEPACPRRRCPMLEHASAPPACPERRDFAPTHMQRRLRCHARARLPHHARCPRRHRYHSRHQNKQLSPSFTIRRATPLLRFFFFRGTTRRSRQQPAPTYTLMMQIRIKTAIRHVMLHSVMPPRHAFMPPAAKPRHDVAEIAQRAAQRSRAAAGAKTPLSRHAPEF